MTYPNGVERVKSFVSQRGLETTVRELPTSTRSSLLAAQALGCTVAEIAKSVVFVDGSAVVVVISGDRRVDLGKLRSLLGRPLEVASADEVRSTTGYLIGGVPPFPHDEGVVVLPDSSLRRFERVWTASGAQNAVMMISASSLIRTIGGPTQDLAET